MEKNWFLAQAINDLLQVTKSESIFFSSRREITANFTQCGNVALCDVLPPWSYDIARISSFDLKMGLWMHRELIRFMAIEHRRQRICPVR